MKPLLTKEDDPIEPPPPPKMKAVLLTFFLRLSSHVMLCKNLKEVNEVVSKRLR